MPTLAEIWATSQAQFTDTWLKFLTSVIGIGAAGAVDPTIVGTRLEQGVTAVNAGAGLFTVTFPTCLDGNIIPYIQQSAAATVTEAIFTAVNYKTGTATLRTSKAGTAVNPASGDLIGFLLIGQTRTNA